MASKKLDIFSISLNAHDFWETVELLWPKLSELAVDGIYSLELFATLKVTLQMVYTDAAAHISGRPDCKGAVRLRPNF